MSLEEYDFKKIGIFLLGLAVIVIAITGSIGSYYFYNKYKNTETLFRQASVTDSASTQAIIDKVGKLIKLPDNEQPTIATVNDLSKLKNQAFFSKAKIGDKVLLYMNAKKAFLYDPVNNVIVEVGPLVVPTPTLALTDATSSAGVAGISTEITTTPKALNIALYNGTDKAGAADKMGADLTAKIGNIRIVQKTNAVKKDYAKSIIIDLTGNNTSVSDTISKELDITVSALPYDEKKPIDADILIIVGSDRS